jgi:23S rRNA (cytidine1920-2'-O)/16S rRNA (cytidine1409-2'-O)-methyltransferase
MPYVNDKDTTGRERRNALFLRLKPAYQIMRLDQYLSENGFFDSRERAQRAVREGGVTVNGQVVRKASQRIDAIDVVEIGAVDALRYVSAGGLKLELAIAAFGLSFSGCTVLDIGASTGGFTDCALQHGALKVFAVDVGESQLHPSLRLRPEVVSLEKQDIRQLQPARIGGPVDRIVVDVSFISLAHIFPCAEAFLRPDGQLIALIKPQFELAGLRFKNGIVRDEKLRRQAIDKVTAYAREQGFALQACIATPADGKTKNVEYMALFTLAAPPVTA